VNKNDLNHLPVIESDLDKYLCFYIDFKNSAVHCYDNKSDELFLTFNNLHRRSNNWYTYDENYGSSGNPMFATPDSLDRLYQEYLFYQAAEEILGE
jgi:hypothetical protein